MAIRCHIYSTVGIRPTAKAPTYTEIAWRRARPRRVSQPQLGGLTRWSSRWRWRLVSPCRWWRPGHVWRERLGDDRGDFYEGGAGKESLGDINFCGLCARDLYVLRGAP